MPLLDVSQILTDPEIADRFTVLRRLEVVGVNGRGIVAVTQIPNVVGVVTMANNNNLDRKEDYQVATRSITVVLKFPVRGESRRYQPDIILWRGDQYVVKHIDLYPQFGQGFYQAECDSMDKTDEALVPYFIPQMSFSTTPNSQFLPLV